jgi:hypothetical protein
MISGTPYRSRRRLAWSALVSLVLNVVVLSAALFYAPRLWGAPRGVRESVVSTTYMSLEKRPESTPQPTVAQPVVQHETQQRAPAPPVHHELSRDVQHAPPQPTAPPRPTTLESRINADQHAFADTVAKLNAQNGAHAIPTIDPATQGGTMKSYAFHAPPGSNAESVGNGIITSTRSWRDRGLDCYYGRYSLTNPDGSEESGEIVWPFCYDPGNDPFRQNQHQIPFPLPMPGYRLPPGTDLPPYEKGIYAWWIAQQ